MEVRVRSRKDASVTKTLPLKVYENLKHAWVRIEDGQELDEDFKKKPEPNVSAPVVATNMHTAVVVNDGVVTDLPVVDTIKADTTLQTEYESLSGKRPDGRWSDEKLKSKINELKKTAV